MIINVRACPPGIKLLSIAVCVKYLASHLDSLLTFDVVGHRQCGPGHCLRKAAQGLRPSHHRSWYAASSFITPNPRTLKVILLAAAFRLMSTALNRVQEVGML